MTVIANARYNQSMPTKLTEIAIHIIFQTKLNFLGMASIGLYCTVCVCILYGKQFG